MGDFSHRIGSTAARCCDDSYRAAPPERPEMKKPRRGRGFGHGWRAAYLATTLTISSTLFE